MPTIFNKDFTLPTINSPAIQVPPHHAPIRAEIQPPASKSLTNRTLLIASLTLGSSTIYNQLKSDDTSHCVDIIKQLRDNDDIKNIYLGSAGTLARFLPGILCATNGTFTLNASQQLSNRPILPLIQSLKDLGADIQLSNPSSPYPLKIKGHSLKGGSTEISGSSSSQFLSGLLLCAPLAKEPVEIIVTDPIVQSGYVQMTLDLMKHFGISISYKKSLQHFHILPQSYQPNSYTIEPDLSTASYFAALAPLTKGSITLKNISNPSLQPDFEFFKILEQLGCNIEFKNNSVKITSPQTLKGNQTFDMQSCSDLVPTLAAIAPFCNGPITIKNVAHIRNHESDRISALCKSFEKLAIPTNEYHDSLTIHPAMPIHATLETFDDHRIAMSLALVGIAGNGVTLKNPQCVSKTCPDFFNLLENLNIQCNIIN